jgi:hypothetical protein
LGARGLTKFEWMPVPFVKRQDFLHGLIQVLLTNYDVEPFDAVGQESVQNRDISLWRKAVARSRSVDGGLRPRRIRAEE